MNAETDQLTLQKKALYALPVLPMAVLHAPALSLVPALYVKYAGISLATAGAIVIAMRCLEGLADPIVGYWSDRGDSWLGKRRPWILGGAIASAISAFFWLQPSPETGPVYFFLASLGVYLGWTILEIPHAAWLPELTRDYNERSRLSAFRAGSQTVGHALFYCVPFLPLFATTDITPEVLGFLAWVLPVLIIAAALPTAFLLKSPLRRSAPMQLKRPLVKGLFKNRPYVLFLCALGLSHAASGMVAGLFFFYMDSYLDIGDKIAHISLATTLVSLASIALWTKALLHFDKHRVLAGSIAGALLALLSMLLISPGDLAFLQLFAVFCLSALAVTGSNICPNTILADIVDYGRLQSENNNSGSYYAVYSLASKIALSFGAGISLVLASLSGFSVDSTASEIEQSAFFLIFLGVPALFYLGSISLVLLFPLSRKRQAIIRRKLEKRSSSARISTSHPNPSQL